MLSVLPELYTFELLGIFLLRVTLGLIFMYFVYSKITKQKNEKVALFTALHLRPPVVFFWIIVLIEFVGGIFLLLGLLVQPTVIILAVIILITLATKILSPKLLSNGAEFYFLLFITLISLLFLGPGFWAIDLPL